MTAGAAAHVCKIARWRWSRAGSISLSPALPCDCVQGRGSTRRACARSGTYAVRAAAAECCSVRRQRCQPCIQRVSAGRPCPSHIKTWTDDRSMVQHACCSETQLTVPLRKHAFRLSCTGTGLPPPSALPPPPFPLPSPAAATALSLNYRLETGTSADLCPRVLCSALAALAGRVSHCRLSTRSIC